MSTAPFAVVFDMDGVLINSHGYVRESFDVVLAHHGLDLERVGDWRGRSLPSILEAIQRDHGITLTVEMFDHVDRIQEEKMRADGIQPDPELIELLDSLDDAGIPIGLGTASPRRRMNKLLDVLGLGGRFAAKITERDVVRHKPYPDVFLAVAEQLAVDPGRCIVIEDAVSGIEAARRAGMVAVGFTAFHEQGYTLEHAGADLLIGSFSELELSYLNELVDTKQGGRVG